MSYPPTTSAAGAGSPMWTTGGGPNAQAAGVPPNIPASGTGSGALQPGQPFSNEGQAAASYTPPISTQDGGHGLQPAPTSFVHRPSLGPGRLSTTGQQQYYTPNIPMQWQGAYDYRGSNRPPPTFFPAGQPSMTRNPLPDFAGRPLSPEWQYSPPAGQTGYFQPFTGPGYSGPAHQGGHLIGDRAWRPGVPTQSPVQRSYNQDMGPSQGPYPSRGGDQGPTPWKDWLEGYRQSARPIMLGQQAPISAPHMQPSFGGRRASRTRPSSPGGASQDSRATVSAAHVLEQLGSSRRSQPASRAQSEASPPSRKRSRSPSPTQRPPASPLDPSSLPDFIYQASPGVIAEAQRPDGYYPVSEEEDVLTKMDGGRKSRVRVSKKNEEKARRDAFKQHLNLLVQSIPGMRGHSDTRKSVVVCTREYVRQIQDREKRLRSQLIRSRLREATVRNVLRQKGVSDAEMENLVTVKIGPEDLERLGEDVEQLLMGQVPGQSSSASLPNVVNTGLLAGRTMMGADSSGSEDGAAGVKEEEDAFAEVQRVPSMPIRLTIPNEQPMQHVEPFTVPVGQSTTLTEPMFPAERPQLPPIQMEPTATSPISTTLPPISPREVSTISLPHLGELDVPRRASHGSVDSPRRARHSSGNLDPGVPRSGEPPV